MWPMGKVSTAAAAALRTWADKRHLLVSGSALALFALSRTLNKDHCDEVYSGQYYISLNMEVCGVYFTFFSGKGRLQSIVFTASFNDMVGTSRI